MTRRRVRTRHLLSVTAVVCLLVAGCGDDDDSGVVASSTSSSSSTSSTTSVVESSTTSAVEMAQPAIWPAADVVFTTPEEAASDFVTNALGVPPVLGEFMQGDARSGEIEVFSPGEGGDGSSVVRGLLLLRQIGPTDGWYVIGAVSEGASISVPEPLAEVSAGPLAVEGAARGFEANVVVSAFVAGHAEPVLDQQVTMGGSFEQVEPYAVTVDLSGAEPGDVVVLLVRGGVGLETDPGEFAAMPVLVV